MINTYKRTANPMYNLLVVLIGRSREGQDFSGGPNNYYEILNFGPPPDKITEPRMRTGISHLVHRLPSTSHFSILFPHLSKVGPERLRAWHGNNPHAVNIYIRLDEQPVPVQCSSPPTGTSLLIHFDNSHGRRVRNVRLQFLRRNSIPRTSGSVGKRLVWKIGCGFWSDNSAASSCVAWHSWRRLPRGR